MTIKELRGKTGLSQKKFSELTDIPYGTLLRWEQDCNRVPRYLLPMLEKALKYDKVIK